MKLLVTGGAGFIGSAVIRHIVRNTNDEVVNLDQVPVCRKRYIIGTFLVFTLGALAYVLMQ